MATAPGGLFPHPAAIAQAASTSTQARGIFNPTNISQITYNQLDDRVLQLIARFLITNKQKIQLIRAQKGGWEAWLQVELAVAFQHDVHFGGLYTIEREQPIFTDSRQRVDICGIPLPGAPTVPPFLGIELKVESAFQTGSQGGLVSRYSDDIRKCSMGPRDDLRSASGMNLYAVGVTSLANDLSGYQEVAKENRGDFFWVELVAGSLYMISWKASWAAAGRQ